MITELSKISGINDSCILIPILSDIKLHPAENNICAVYIKGANNDYIIPVDHPESSVKVSYRDIEQLLETIPIIYVLNKKEFLHIFPTFNNHRKVYDLNLLHYYNNNTPLDLDNITTPAHNFYISKYRNIPKINRIIPILKHSELCSTRAETALKSTSFEASESFIEYNDKVISSLYHIEKVGINRADKIMYTEYNIFTAAGRPSNRYGGINYAALNKDDGTRRKYWSRFKMGGMLELDFDAYHLRLIANLINYELPKTSVHEYLGKQYFDKDQLTKEEYNKSKEISFTVLYGGIPKEFMGIEFFKKTITFINDLWADWNSKKYITTYLFKRPIYARNHKGMNKQKLFNYYIQAYETEQNIMTMDKIFKVLKNYNSKLVLYTYDSFLFDFDIKDGNSFIQDIKNTMKYPVKTQFGANYDDMKDVSNKIKLFI
jgi:hypothetical protein